MQQLHNPAVTTASTGTGTHEYSNHHRCNAHAHHVVRYAHSNTQTGGNGNSGGVPLNHMASDPGVSAAVDDDEETNIKQQQMAETVLMSMRSAGAGAPGGNGNGGSAGSTLRHRVRGGGGNGNGHHLHHNAMSDGGGLMRDLDGDMFNFTMMRDRCSQKYDRVDRIAMWLFPIFFFLFNIAYWSYYLLLNDIINELW